MDESLPATAPSAHPGFSKGSLGPHVTIIMIGTSVCNKNHSLTMISQVVAMTQWDNPALLTQWQQVRVRLDNYRFFPKN